MESVGPQILEACTARDLEEARALFFEYAESLGWDLTQGGRLADEVVNLPGPYAQPAGSLLLARVDGTPAGALGLQPVPPDARIEGIGAENFGELKRLYVRPEFRGSGIGTALLKRSEDEARARGYDALVLTTSVDLFPLAQRVYERLGYVATQPYRNDMDWPDLLWLRLDL